MRSPRKTKKAARKALFSYDVNTIPVDVDFDYLNTIFHHTGLLIYDGTRGYKPEVLSRPNKRVKVLNCYSDYGISKKKDR